MQTNKSDYIDAEAIAEAVRRPRMRFLPIKTEEQLDWQTLSRLREPGPDASHGGGQRDPVAFFWSADSCSPKAEAVWIRFCRGSGKMPVAVVGSFPLLRAQLKLELEPLCARIDQLDVVILQRAKKEDEAYQQLTTNSGVGPPHDHSFDRCCWEGERVSKRSRSGSPDRDGSGRAFQQTLLGISKRRNSYLQRLFAQGPRIVLQPSGSRFQLLVSSVIGPPE